MPIPIVIPVGRTFSATATGRAIKATVCEQCKTEYVYALTRSHTMKVSDPMFLNPGARDEATAHATTGLSNILDNAFDPIPCPSCGHYQQYMIPLVRKRRYRWVNRAALIFAVIAGIGFFAYVVAQSRDPEFSLAGPVLALVACIGLAMAVPLARRLLTRHYDPDAIDSQRRIELGLSLALTKDEYLQQLRDRDNPKT